MYANIYDSGCSVNNCDGEPLQQLQSGSLYLLTNSVTLNIY